MATMLMPQLGRLPLGVRTIRDETLPSYVDRLAARYGATRLDILTAAGLRQRGDPTLTGYGIDLAAGPKQRFARAAGLDVDQVTSMLVASLQERLGSWGFNSDGATGPQLRDAAQHNWVFFAGSWACPQCLTAYDRAWRLRWRTPWSFGCVEHRVHLLDDCAACSVPLFAGKKGEGRRAVYGAIVPPGTCDAGGLQRVADRPVAGCGADLGQMTTDPLGARQLAALAIIDGALDDGRALMLGGTVASADFFAHAQSLAGLVQRFAEREDLGELPISAAHAFNAQTADREQQLEEARVAGLRAPLLRYGTATPRSATLMSAVAPTVVEALLAVNEAEFAQRLRWLAGRIRAAGQLPGSIQGRYQLPHAIHEALAASGDGEHRLWKRRRASCNRPAAELKPFEPRHVPHVMWREAWDVLFVELIPNSRRLLPVRNFLSLLLVKDVHELTWAQAARAIDFDYFDPVQRANSFTTRTRALDVQQQMRERIHVIANVLGDERRQVDYAERRARFAVESVLPEPTWRDICERAGSHPGLGTRHRHAEIWLWSELTGSPLHRAPAAAGFLQDADAERGKPVADQRFWARYCRFYYRELPTVREELSAHGQELLGVEPLRPVSEAVLRRALVAARA